jgi:tetratricopeptide (TPR) repeat protein
VGIALATSNLGRVAAHAGRFDEALQALAEALSAFRALGSTAFVQETEARRVESFVLAGRYQEALDVAPAVLEEADENPLLHPFLERLHGYALVQARRADEAGLHLERSLELARELGADYQVALTLEALGRTGVGDPDAVPESTAIFERLGVVSTPVVPLP